MCASANATTSYEELSKAVGTGSAQNANWAFGSIHALLQFLQREPKFDGENFPDISSIVTNKNRLTGGRGAFLSNKKLLQDSKLEQINWLELRREQVFRYPRWSEVLAYLGIAPLNDLSTTRERLEKFGNASRRRSGEGVQHQEIKDWIAMDPRRILGDLTGPFETQKEAPFWSLDRLDVSVQTPSDWIGIEVKPPSASVDEIRRGLYQVIKYRALIAAELLVRGSKQSPRCVLVLGGELPSELCELAHRFGIIPLQNISTMMLPKQEFPDV